MVPVAATVLVGAVALAIGFGGGWIARRDTSPTSTSTSTTSTSSTSTSTTAVPLARCTGADLSGTLQPSQGAAGTVTAVLVVTNSSAAPCFVDGYPQLQLLNANMGRITTSTDDGGLTGASGAAAAPPRRLRVAPGGQVSVELQYSDVPVGNEQVCATSASIDVYPPGSTVPFNVTGAISPCDYGAVHVSPLYS